MTNLLDNNNNNNNSSTNCSIKYYYSFQFSYDPSLEEILTKQLGKPQYFHFADNYFDTNDFQYIKSNVWLKERISDEGRKVIYSKKVILNNDYNNNNKDFIEKYKEFIGDELKKEIENNPISKKFGFVVCRSLFPFHNVDNYNKHNHCEISLDQITFKGKYTLYVGSIKSINKEDIEKLKESSFKDCLQINSDNACRSAALEYIRMFENSLFKDLMELGHVSKEEEQLKNNLYSEYNESDLEHLDFRGFTIILCIHFTKFYISQIIL
ncbi:hypothetical protein ABK040_008682 [Willaertia magna]